MRMSLVLGTSRTIFQIVTILTSIPSHMVRILFSISLWFVFFPHDLDWPHIGPQFHHSSPFRLKTMMLKKCLQWSHTVNFRFPDPFQQWTLASSTSPSFPFCAVDVHHAPPHRQTTSQDQYSITAQIGRWSYKCKQLIYISLCLASRTSPHDWTVIFDFVDLL